MNRVFMVGNITGDIYFDRFLMKGERRSFLRLILMAEHPRAVRGMRIVLWDQKAELYYPEWRKNPIHGQKPELKAVLNNW